MARPKPLSGFPEFLPAARMAEQAVLDILRDDPGDTRPETDLRQLPELLAEFRAAGARIEMVGREVVDAEAVPSLLGEVSEHDVDVGQAAAMGVVVVIGTIIIATWALRLMFKSFMTTEQ